MRKVIINGKFVSQNLTGVQRFACEISKRLPYPVIHPPSKNLSCPIGEKLIKSGPLSGNAWEQLILPHAARGNLLLNLSNTAPLIHPYNVVTIHDIAWMKYPESFSRTFVHYYSFLIPRIARRALHIFTVSQFSKEEIVNNLKVDPDKITVIYNGVSPSFKILNIRKEPIILSVATLQPYKNLERLVQAFILGKERKIIPEEYKLVLVGGINKKVFASSSRILKEFSKRNDIELPGYMEEEELVRIYNKAYIFVFVSLYEGFGLPPLEAMACGTPVILSRRASLPEVGGNAALYVDPENVEEIAENIGKLIEDHNLWNHLRKSGLKRASEFTWEKSSEKVKEVITNLQL